MKKDNQKNQVMFIRGNDYVDAFGNILAPVEQDHNEEDGRGIVLEESLTRTEPPIKEADGWIKADSERRNPKDEKKGK